MKTATEQAQDYILKNPSLSSFEIHQKLAIHIRTVERARKELKAAGKWKPPVPQKSPAKVLIVDIETAPLKAWVWDVWKQNVNPAQIISEWFCLTWAAKWLFEKKVYSDGLTGKEAIAQNDKRIMKSLWVMMNEADIVIAHNGEKFDIPKINTRFLIHRLQPPMPYLVIDTLKHSRKQFAFSHNKLDSVNGQLGFTRKREHEGFALWDSCCKGDEKSLKKMLWYNQGDITSLEEYYLGIRAWIKPHPNVGLYILDEISRCPSCGSDDILFDKKYYYTTVNRFEAFRCKCCGSTGRVRLSDINVKQRRHITSSIPK